MVSFNTDGKFTIKQGQGITQGIQEELQLSDAECKQLGSIWNKVIEEIKTDGNVKVENNRNEKPTEGNNFRVHENAVIEFTSSSWNKIVGWVNQKLGKDIGVETTETETDANPTNNSLECAKNAMKLINQNIKNIQLPQGLSAEQFAKNLKESYEEQIADLPSETTVADMAQSILTTAFCKGKKLNDAEKTDMQKIALRNAATLAPDDSICGVKCSEILNNEEAAFNKLFGGQSSIDTHDDDNPENNALLEQTKRVLNNLKNNINKIELPANVNRDEFISKLNNFDINRMLVLSQQDYRGERLGLPENQSDADVAAAIMSEILGMHDNRESRGIKSDIAIRKIAIDNTLNIYSDSDTIRGTAISQIKKTRDEHQQVLDDAREYIKSHFETSGLSKQVDKDLFLQCLASVTLDVESSGAGRNEDGVFTIETNDNDIQNWSHEMTSDGKTKNTALTRMIKLLVHETYHNYLDLSGHHDDKPTKKEEATCEMLALMVTANLCNNDPNLTSFDEYGYPITYYTSKDSVVGNQSFESWLNGYDKHDGEAKESIRDAKEDIKL